MYPENKYIVKFNFRIQDVRFLLNLKFMNCTLFSCNKCHVII